MHTPLPSWVKSYRPIEPIAPPDVGFSNRPFGVKRFQTIHRHGVGVTRGLVLLYGIGT